jgi:hypothetical protein
VTQAILPAFIVAGIVDAGFSREHALLRAGITDPGYNEQRKFSSGQPLLILPTLFA